MVNSLIKLTTQRQDKYHRLGFPNFGTTDIWGWTSLYKWGCPGLHPLDVSSTPYPLSCDTKHVSRHYQMSQNCPQLKTTAVDHVSRGQFLEIHPDIDKSVTKDCRPRGVPRLFKLTGAAHLNHAEGKTNQMVSSVDLFQVKMFILFGSSQTKQRVILVNPVSAVSKSQDQILTYGFLINGTERSATILWSDRDGSSSEKPK